MTTSTADPKPIVIIFTVKPPKSNKRLITVSAAPEGEMPVMLTGQFSDRHALLDQIFAELLKRKPQTVKVPAEKTAAGKKEPTEFPDEAEAETGESPAPARKCRICGCTDAQACEGGCTWIGDDLCSNCEDKALEPDRPVRSDEMGAPDEVLPEIEGDTDQSSCAPDEEPDADTSLDELESQADRPIESEFDQLEDPDDRNAPSAQPDSDDVAASTEVPETQTTLF